MFADEAKRVRIAQRFRGGGFDGGLLHRAAAARMLLVPLLLSAIHRSGHLAMAVELRGIRSSIDVLFEDERAGRNDVVFALLTSMVLVLAFLIG